jgi:hypothetical protein
MKYTFVITSESNNWELLATKESELPTGEMAAMLLSNMKALALKGLPKEDDPMYAMKFGQVMMRVNLINKMGGIPYNLDSGAIVINRNGGYHQLGNATIREQAESEFFPL